MPFEVTPFYPRLVRYGSQNPLSSPSTTAANAGSTN
jgi:hypothetical protein